MASHLRRDSAEVPALVVFDVGGTTIADRGDVPAAFHDGLSACGLRVDPDELAASRGASKRAVCRELVARQRPDLTGEARDELASRAYDGFSAALETRLRRSADLAIPGVRQTVGRLKAAGIQVALNSGFDRRIMGVILAAVGWPGDLFDAVVCADDVACGRPAPFMIFHSMERTAVADVRRVAVVGDTRLDLEAGMNAGAAYRIGVLTGAHDRATLERASPTHIVSSAAAVPDLWLSEAARAGGSLHG